MNSQKKTVHANPLPPLSILEAALHETTERLVSEIVRPTNERPRWNEFEWRIAEAAASIQGVSAILADRLLWRGPKHWQSFLAGQKHHTALRRERIAALLERIDTEAKREGIALVALKGSALYSLDLYPGCDRPMGDIDLLARSHDVEPAVRLLTALDYKEEPSSERHRAFVPADAKIHVGLGEHIDNPLKIELHSRIAEYLPLAETDITALEFPSQAQAGINPYPSTAALMRHLLLHAATNMRARALRFIQLHDIALLSDRMNKDDWDELLHVGVGARGLWWALAPLALTARYYPTAIPHDVIAAAAPGAPWLLRRAARRHVLMDVSWSKLKIQAFPGIEWSKSLPEALKFMRSRIFPSRTALAGLHYTATTLPYAVSTPWYGLSHINRIVRWVFSHPPRVQAMYPIKMALGIQPP